MSTTSASDTLPRRIARFLPSGRAWWLVAGAFVAGLLLFALVLSNRGGEFEFYRAERDDAAGAEHQVFEPLPEPLPAGGDSASGMDTASAGAAAPRVDQHASAPEDAASQAPVDTPSPESPAVAATAEEAALPRPLTAPPPEYPRAALRSGASGNVLLLIEVDAEGRPGAIEVVESSRHRELDRAAVNAVRRWRFQPAMRGGIAVPATVRQAFSFDAPD